VTLSVFLLSKNAITTQLERRVLQLLKTPKTQPMTRSELARTLEVPPDMRSYLREAIRSLEAAGKIQRNKGGRYSLPTPKKKSRSGGITLTGVMKFYTADRSRNGWLLLDQDSRKALAKQGEYDRLFVPARYAGTTLDGDSVEAELHTGAPAKWERHVKRRNQKRDSRPGDQRLEARVVKITSRKRSRFLGDLRLEGKFAHVKMVDPLFTKNMAIDRNRLPREATDGQRVLVKLLEWESTFHAPKGEVVKILGYADDPGVDILSIIHKHGLPIEFPQDVLDEAAAISDTVTDKDLEGREDWRDKMVFTIDPFDARDFDDAIFVEALPDGGWKLGVFIADVAHYVKRDSKLDKEARKRGNSVYLVDRVIPMLPTKLSNGICSLVPDQDRLTHAVIMEFDGKGQRKKSRFIKAVIRSQRRYSYEEAFEKLQQPRPENPQDLEERTAAGLHTAWDLASRIRQLRMKNGSLDLDFPEVKVILDDQGKPIELRKVEYDISHQLIEEFMLAANESVAEFTKNSQSASVYRIHEDPDVDKLFEFRELARSYNYQVGDLSLRTELQKLLKAVRGKPEEHALKIGLLKSLKRAAYSEQPLGHYGLAKVNYTHFTSPIRRYADLVVHRVLQKLATIPDDPAPLPHITFIAESAEHLSTTERTAADAENESKLLKQFEFFLNLAEQRESPSFEAVITEIMTKGIMIELSDYFLRGMVRRIDLPRRELFLDSSSQRVLDKRHKPVLKPGDRIQVQVRRVDMEKKHLDFVLAEVVG